MLRRLGLVLCLFISACTIVRPISPSGMKAFELSLAASNADMMVAWHGGPIGHDAIYIHPIDSAGRAIGSPHRITDAERYGYEPDLQLIDGDALLAWYEKDARTGELTAWLSRLDHNGRSFWRHQLNASGGYARNPVVRLYGDTVMAAWIETTKGETPAVWVARFNADGSQQGQARKAGAVSLTTWNLNAAIDRAGTFYVTYDAKLATQASELRLLAVRSDNASEVAISSDDGFASVYPDIAVNNDGIAALTWFDDRDGNEEVYLAIMPLADLLAGAPTSARRITHTPASSIGAYLAWNGDRLALVWCDAVNGQQELYFQTFRNGLSESAIQRLTHTLSQSSIPSVRPFGTGFAIAWNEYQAAGEGMHREILASEARVAILR